jgi:short-subunit dehydrogenase
VSAICPGIIDTAIVRDGMMRGELSGRAEKIEAFYRRRGASPDVVAESVVDAVRRNRLIVPVPRSHVVPAWLVERLSPRLSQVLGRATARFVLGRD